MSVVKAAFEYVKAMIERVQGMKVLLVDAETLSITSMVFSQSQILEKEVFLVEKLESMPQTETLDVTGVKPPRMKHLKAICFLRPTPQNFILLNKELKSPRFSEYHIFFSNIVSPQRLDQLANSDELESVLQVQEYFCDFYAINDDLFSLGLPSYTGLTLERSLWTPYEDSVFQRMVEGLFAASVALRSGTGSPFIRFSRSSALTAAVGQAIQNKIDENRALFGGSQSNGGQIIILDRRDDPVTPLLNQWTYQAMLHELIGLDKNRLLIKTGGGSTNPSEEYTFAPSQDSFYAGNLLSNFGDLGLAVKSMVENFQKQTHSTQTSQIQSVEDMQKFIDQYPEFRKQSGNVSKHVAAVHALSALIDKNNLLTVSSLEQDLVCDDSKVQDHFRRVLQVLGDPQQTGFEKLRLALLFWIRYGNEAAGPVELTQLKEGLSIAGIDQSQINLIDALYSFTSSFVKGHDLFRQGVLSLAKKAIERQFGGASNVYTQHKSWLFSVAENALKNKLKDTQFPVLTGQTMQYSQTTTSNSSGPIILFIVGGATFEEARDIQMLNSALGSKIVLGGSTIHNSKSFLADVAQLNLQRRQQQTNSE